MFAEKIPSNAPEWSVSDLAGALKRTLEEAFGFVRLRGEISGYRGPHSSGHAYFCIKDQNARIDAVIWKGSFARLRIKPEEGMEVIATGRITTFPGSSKYQIVVEALEPAGIGALMALLEERRRKLNAEGLFAPERKRRLPRFPRGIGLLTGNDAAAKRDVLTAITTRFPPARVVVAEAYVQGPRAAPALVTALEDLCRVDEVDVIVLTRGGGSFEDLLPFSDERLVRAVAACAVPIVSAVGHEQDTPLTDLAADARASTPSLAARLVVPDADELRERLTQTRRRLNRAPLHLLERKRARLAGAHGRLRALSPRATLQRGYAIVRDGNRIVRAAAEVTTGTRVDVELGQGGFGATVEETR